MATTRKSHKSRRAQAPQKPATGAGTSTRALAVTSQADPPTTPETAQKDFQGHMPPLPEEKPFWYRPTGGGTHKKFEKIAVMRAAGRDSDDIAKRLKTTAAMVRQIEYLAKKNGWATDDGEPIDVEAQLALEIDRKVVRNIAHSLDGGMTNYQTHEMTIAAAKGRGIFRAQNDQAAAAPVMAPVAIQIIMPAVGVSDQKIIEENVGGVPAYIEGEVDGPERSEAGDGDKVLPGA